MSAARLLVALAVLVGLEAGIFYVRHADVVRLSRSRTAVVADEGFTEAAQSVLARERVSRRVLERVADVAHERRAFELQVRALERIVAAVPADGDARLRLAEALRDAGRLDEAERIYRAELGFDQGGEP
jgi:thioredoxin-like negative regulator of GroEL